MFWRFCFLLFACLPCSCTSLSRISPCSSFLILLFFPRFFLPLPFLLPFVFLASLCSSPFVYIFDPPKGCRPWWKTGPLTSPAPHFFRPPVCFLHPLAWRRSSCSTSAHRGSTNPRPKCKLVHTGGSTGLHSPPTSGECQGDFTRPLYVFTSLSLRRPLQGPYPLAVEPHANKHGANVAEHSATCQHVTFNVSECMYCNQWKPLVDGRRHLSTLIDSRRK